MADIPHTDVSRISRSAEDQKRKSKMDSGFRRNDEKKKPNTEPTPSPNPPLEGED